MICKNVHAAAGRGRLQPVLSCPRRKTEERGVPMPDLVGKHPELLLPLERDTCGGLLANPEILSDITHLVDHLR